MNELKLRPPAVDKRHLQVTPANLTRSGSTRGQDLNESTASPHLCMRLMCSQNQAELDAVIQELAKAGISAETRTHPIAEALGVPGKELWVPNEQDFYTAAKLFARLQAPELLVAQQPEPPVELDINEVFRRRRPSPEKPEPVSTTVQVACPPDRQTALEPRELEQASSLLEKEIEEMLNSEGELSRECASLRSKVRQLGQTLADQQAVLAREIQTRQADALYLSRYIQALELQRDEDDKCLNRARTELAAEREQRLAAEQQAKRAALAKMDLQKQLVERHQLQDKLQSRMASLDALYDKLRASRTTRRMAAESPA